jgi:hypothetical protein
VEAAWALLIANEISKDKTIMQSRAVKIPTSSSRRNSLFVFRFRFRFALSVG